MRTHSHSHGPGHSHGQELLNASGGWKNPGVRVTWIGLVCNVGMAVGKGVGGVVFHSQSLLADAVHALSDLVSDFLTLATIHFIKKPPSQYFPDGYGKIEAMGAFGVNSLLVFAGLSMGWSGITTVAQTLIPDSTLMHYIGMLGHGHSHSHGHTDIADWNAAWIALGSIFVKEALFQMTYRVGKRQNSPVLIANAWHHRVDCYASIVALLAISGGQLFQASWLDPLGGIIVSGAVFHAGWTPLKQAFLQLIGSNKELMTSPMFSTIVANATASVKASDPTLKIGHVHLKPYGTSYVAYVQIIGGDNSNYQRVHEASEALVKDLLAADTDLKHVYVTLNSDACSRYEIQKGQTVILPGEGPGHSHDTQHNAEHTHEHEHEKK